MPLQKRGDRDDHRFVEGLLAIRIDEVEPTQRQSRREEAWQTARGNPAPPGRLRAEFRADTAMVARVTNHVDILEVADPVAAAAEFDDHPTITASPVHALGFHWHTAMTATKPSKPDNPVAFAKLPPANRDRVIAVVDTGIAQAAALPGWMNSSVIHGRDDVEDPDDDAPSHGTFVASLLRQVAPTHAVSMARSGSYDDGDQRGPDHPAPEPTTEFHIADAIHRLIERHQGRPSVVRALNLSVGGTAITKEVMVTVRSAIARWREVFPTTPIFAAAGNSPETMEVYPAAFRYVRGVAAASPDGDQIVWDTQGAEVDPNPPQRNWVDDIAPGSNLIGLGGRAVDDIVKWSGSSFATAVAAASYVNGGPVEVRDGLSYWPDRGMGYGDVPGLKFE